MLLGKEYSFTVEGRPRPKARPRVTKRGGTFTPKDTVEWENTIKDSYEGPDFGDMPVCVEANFYKDRVDVRIYEAEWSSGVRGDVDNLAKSLLDGLHGKAFNDDRQVVLLLASKED